MTVTLPELKSQNDDMSFPHDVLVGCKTALSLFAAGYYGRQDAVWLEDAGLRATCVDLDAEKLAVMEDVYPESWEFVVADVFEFASSTDRQWDVLCADPWTQDFQACADRLGEWCRLARHAVILASGVGTDVLAPAGLSVTKTLRRSDHDGGVFWTVLERA